MLKQVYSKIIIIITIVLVQTFVSPHIISSIEPRKINL